MTEAVKILLILRTQLTINHENGTIRIDIISLGNACLISKFLCLSENMFMNAIYISINAKHTYTTFHTSIHSLWNTSLNQNISQYVQSGDRSHPASIISGVIINVMIQIRRLNTSTIHIDAGVSLVAHATSPAKAQSLKNQNVIRNIHKSLILWICDNESLIFR
jgi:hypothetical protein